MYEYITLFSCIYDILDFKWPNDLSEFVVELCTGEADQCQFMHWVTSALKYRVTQPGSLQMRANYPSQ